jgi:putative transcriptional regulator
VNLDPEKIRRLRQEQNISLGMVARHVRVSRRTVAMYEDGMNARIEIANRIEELFEQPVTTPIDLFTFIQQAEVIQPVQREQDPKKDLQSEVFSHLENVGYKVIPMDRCPFEALSKEREKILLTCVQEYNKRLREKAHILSSISRITERYAVVFTDKDVSTKNVEGTPIIMKKELKKIRDPEDVFTLILERSSPE